MSAGLAALLDECIGPDYRTHPDVCGFSEVADDPGAPALRAIKHENKVRFAKYAYAKTGQKIDNHSVYDTQISACTVQAAMLNALNIIGLYLGAEGQSRT